jgi:hypothetical protein
VVSPSAFGLTAVVVLSVIFYAGHLERGWPLHSNRPRALKRPSSQFLRPTSQPISGRRPTA